MEADYIVVGAGSAGCVVAARLSESGAGGDPAGGRSEGLSAMDPYPGGGVEAAEPSRGQLELQRRGQRRQRRPRIHWPRGKTLGGSSSINGMLYVRGNPADFDGWAQMGCRGWSFDDVLPYFRKSEDYKQAADPEYRGKDGPLKVEDYRTILPLTHCFVAAAQQAGASVQRRPERAGAGRCRLLPDDPHRPLARIDRADFSEGGAGRPTCGWKPRRWRPGCCSTANAAGVTFRQRGRHRCAGVAGGDPVRRGGQFAAPAAGFGRRPAAHCNPSGCRWCTICRASAPIAGPLRGADVPPGRGAVSINTAGAGDSVGAGGDAFRGRGPRRADLRRHHRAGLLPLGSGKGESGPAASLYAGELRLGAVRRAGTPGRHDRRGVPGAAGQPGHDHGRSPDARCIRSLRRIICPIPRRAGAASGHAVHPGDFRLPRHRGAQRGRDVARVATSIRMTA